MLFGTWSTFDKPTILFCLTLYLISIFCVLTWSVRLPACNLSTRNVRARSACLRTAGKSPMWKASCSQYHQHFTSSFSTNILLAKNFKAKPVTREKLQKTLLYKKVNVKCWWNWHLDEGRPKSQEPIGTCFPVCLEERGYRFRRRWPA